MRAVVLCLGFLLAAACQPAGGPGAAPTPETRGPATAPALGAPDTTLPATLEQLLDGGRRQAEEWQTEPVLVEVEVQVDEAGRWLGARLVYLAADADRFLQLTAAGAGFSQERVTLSTLNVEPVTTDGMAAVPGFPTNAAEPAALASSDATATCALSGDVTVFYLTGAPVAWDGTTWSPPPAWTVTVTGGDGASATMAVDGADVQCLE